MKKILFVEDNGLIARIYSQKLAGVGFEVAIAEDGLEAMRVLPDFKPDLVVLDLLMPRMTGADVLKFMRQHPQLKTIPVVVFSNSFLSGLVEQIAALKVEATLVKAAVTPARLVEVINKTLALGGREAGVATIPATPPPEKAEVKAVKAAVPESKKPEPPPPAEKSPAPPGKSETDSEFVTRIGQQFLERAPIVFKDLREMCRIFLEAAKTPAEGERLMTLNRRLGFLTQITAMAGYHRTAELSSALEALLFELSNKPESVNDSTRQTIASTIAFLADRFERLEPAEEKGRTGTNILVVDDDAVSNLAVSQALGRANLSVVSITDPMKALQQLKVTRYGVVLLDVAMPVMDGLTLCEKMRALPGHKRTPVIFITGYTDFNTHARSILSGGNDLITKPILANELCVKVITHLLKAS